MNTVRPKQGSTRLSRIGRRSGFGIVESRFHEESTTRLPDGAERCVNWLGVRREDVQVFSCAGAFELPQGSNLLFEAESYVAIICLGAVSRGESPHVEQISSDAARTIQDPTVHRAVPGRFGVLTADNPDQAHNRAGSSEVYEGWDAARFGIRMTPFSHAQMTSRWDPRTVRMIDP